MTNDTGDVHIRALEDLARQGSLGRCNLSDAQDSPSRRAWSRARHAGRKAGRSTTRGIVSSTAGRSLTSKC